MTANQLRQVLRTYEESFWLFMLPWLLMHALLFCWSSAPERLPDLLWLTQMSGMGLGAIMGVTLKLQFSNSGARLLPDFRAAHLIVAGAIVGAATAIEAVIILTAGAAALLILVSLTLLTVAVFAWLNYWMSPMSSVCSCLIVVSICAIPLARPNIAGPLHALNDSPIVSLGIACAGLAAMAALGARLWMLSEEMPEYSRRMPGRLDFTSRTDNRKWRRWEAQVISRSGIQGWLRDVQFRLVLRPNMAMGPLRRLLLRQLAGGFSGLALMTVGFVSMLSLLLFQAWLRKPLDASSVFILSFIPQHIVFCMLSSIWLRRWPFLARESLWPLGRREFVRDSARSMACDIAGPAAVHCAMIVIWLKLICPQVAPPGLLLPWLSLTIAQYMVAYCLMFWLVSFRRYLVLVLVLAEANAVSATLVIAALFFSGRGFWSPASVSAAIIATAFGVALLYQAAFRRWCRIDFG